MLKSGFVGRSEARRGGSRHGDEEQHREAPNDVPDRRRRCACRRGAGEVPETRPASDTKRYCDLEYARRYAV